MSCDNRKYKFNGVGDGKSLKGFDMRFHDNPNGEYKACREFYEVYLPDFIGTMIDDGWGDSNDYARWVTKSCQTFQMRLQNGDFYYPKPKTVKEVYEYFEKRVKEEGGINSIFNFSGSFAGYRLVLNGNCFDTSFIEIYQIGETFNDRVFGLGEELLDVRFVEIKTF